MTAPVPHTTATVLRPLGTPLPVGFLGLAGGALAVSALQLGWIPLHEHHAVALVLLSFAFPLQLLAALLGFRGRDTAFATAMAVLAASWLVQGALLAAGPASEARHTLGVFLVTAAAALLVPLAASGATKLAASAVIACATVRLALAGIHQLTRSPAWEDAAGAAGLALVLLALYAATAFALEDTGGRPALPVGRHGSGARAMEHGAEPGIRPLL
ncbi:GPR1/FUN34/YaaH family transporter [Streptomyces sp. NRRL F-2580]|uniref:GPR1/FUN34/YaaH family transporter n=1 Tax=Streptomyces sp. NRRL F-2580 TaxID=1463841 RepID=UPI0006894B74|nr:GPR1/FUN34/YaaH family transporter [Streptomyces sp. NRRL F-2580]